ncbi:hypothetical protein pb186bvf_021092 [Paramecium bursaria]
MHQTYWHLRVCGQNENRIRMINEKKQEHQMNIERYKGL